MYLRVVSGIGMVTLIAIAWIFSTRRDRFPWRTVLSGLALEFFVAALILKTPFGTPIFGAARTTMNQLGVYAQQGAAMVFGPLADTDSMNKALGGGGVVFAIVVTSTIIIVSALSSLLYHYGILQRVVHATALVMQKVMRTSGSESLAAASNIFLGTTEAALIIRPYLPRMTMSELHALVVTGMASIAVSVFAVYAQMGIDAGHLLAASVLSAPAGLMMAKILYPETLESETSGSHTATVERQTVNGFDALCSGASEGMMLSINVIAMLIAFVAIVALADGLLAWPQQMFGVATPVTLQQIFGWINWPFAWLLGIPAADCDKVGQVLGERIVLNEFIAYLDLAKLGHTISERSTILTTYALCGFANFSSIAIAIGGIGALAPERRHDLARIGFRAMVGGLLATYLMACIAGILI
ncbi:MAG TPA: nucleoside transporter C-terminal domain-containing protein [Chthoniobacterales bacterium]|nr:nucleoside transporter C-terminal domain-containing protein [Chthoniobacterales bacterium]